MESLSNSCWSAGRPWHKTGMLLMLAVVLASVTIFCMQYLERFFVAEEQLLIDPQFSAKNVHWDEKGGGVVTFQNNQLTISNIPATNKNVFQNIKVDVPAYYRFEFKAGVDEVIPASTEKWALATIVLSLIHI